MSLYSIKQLELLSGIKAHTIRIWEKRYGLFSPSRTKTNIRKYTDDDVRLILNISLLVNKGYRISKVANKSLKEISKLTLQQGPKESLSNTNKFEPLIIATFSFSSTNFIGYLTKKVDELGFNQVYEDIILPFLERIGLLWQAGAILTTHEHFASNLIKQFITVKINQLEDTNKVGSSPVLFFLPEGEFHEIGLLFYAYIFKQKGFNVIYFGQSTPTEDIIKSALTLNANIIFTSGSTKFSKLDLKLFFKNLNKALPNSELFVTGYLYKEPNDFPKQVKVISSVNNLEKYLKPSKSKNH